MQVGTLVKNADVQNRHQEQRSENCDDGDFRFFIKNDTDMGRVVRRRSLAAIAFPKKGESVSLAPLDFAPVLTLLLLVSLCLNVFVLGY